MASRISGSSTSILLQIAVALLAVLGSLSSSLGSLQAQVPAAGEPLTYQLKETWIEAGGGWGGDTTLLVEQAGSVAVARHESDGSLAMVSNPTAGVIIAAPTRGLPFLMELLEFPEDLGPGTELPIGNDWVQVIESIEFSLERGDSDRSLEGHQTEHRILTIDLKLQQVGPDGNSSSARGTGRVDLWTAPDLPFSWLPYTSPNAYLWALPLSLNYQQVTAHVLAELSDELLGLGLLLRAEVKGSIGIAEIGSEQVYSREITVEALQMAAEPLDMAVFDQPVLTVGDYKALMSGMMLAGMSCTQEAPAGAGGLTLNSDQPREISAEGAAWRSPEPALEGMTALVVGSLGETEGSCVVVLTEPTGPEPGEYALHAGVTSDVWETIPPPKASAYYLRGNEASPQLTLIDTGTLNIEETGEGKLQAILRGNGWTADLTPESPSLIEDVDFKLSFEVDAPTVKESIAAEVVPVPAAWTPLAFDPAAREPVAEWDFDGKGVRWGAIDAQGKYAAVALSSEPVVILLDLENRSELGAIEVYRDSSGNHVSSLAFEPSGNRLAIGMPMGMVWVVDTTTHETLQEIQYSKDGRSYTNVAKLQFDPAGGRVLGFTGNAIVAWDPDSGEVLSTWEVAGAVPDLAVTSDGTRAAMIISMKSVMIRDIQTGSEICALPGDFSSLAIHPAGDRFAAWSFEKRVMVASIADCSEIASWPAAPSFVPETAIAWAADGKHLILGSAAGPLHVYTEQGESAGVWSGQGQTSLIFTSPGSSRVFSTAHGEDSKAILWENE